VRLQNEDSLCKQNNYLSKLKMDVRFEQWTRYKYSEDKQYDYDCLVSTAVPFNFV